MKPETIIDEIEGALVANRRFMDALRCDEDTMWAALDESVNKGFRTAEEAQAEFLSWRDNMRSLGGLAIRES